MKKILITLLIANVTQAQTLELWGMCEVNGNLGSGCLYKIKSDGTGYSQLVNFNGTNGGSPSIGGLVQAANGKLYGMTEYGGTYNLGVLYSVDHLSGTQTVELSFRDTLGTNPRGTMIRASNGILYGVTRSGGREIYPLINILRKKKFQNVR